MPVQMRFNELKTTEASVLFLQMSGGRMHYLLLLKLLYLMDRYAFARWERPVTYDNYVSMNRGPVLSCTYNLILGKVPQSKCWDEHIETIPGYKVKLKEELRIQELSQAEIDLIHEVFARFGNTDRFDLSEFTHQFPEYKNPHGSSTPITRSDLLSALKYSPEDIERINSEINEEASINALFGDGYTCSM